MNWINAALDEFGRRAGLPHWGFDGAGVAQLRFASGDILAVEQAGDDVLLYLEHRSPWLDGAALGEALRRANARRLHGRPLQLGLRGQGQDSALVIALRIAQREFTAVALESGWDAIARWRDDWQARR